MKQYKLWNNIFGWVAFAVAAFTYFSTMEPTASFWDCPEFIACGYKMEIGHPPGAPFFMLIQRFFSLFAKDPAHIAICVNSWSAIASALTIMFLFWTITQLARKIVKPENGTYKASQIIAIIGSGLVGSLLYAFTDSFWFSAVEAEVYASSAVFTAVVFWAIFKWEEAADKPYGDRWLILIAYLMGLSIGVHLLNLLTIPAMVLVYYFKKFKVTPIGAIIAIGASFLILAFIEFSLVPGALTVASWFELLFINQFGMSFNTGFVFYAILLIIVLVWGIYETLTNKNPIRTKFAFILGIVLSGIPFLGESIVLGIIIIAGLIALFYFVKNIDTKILNTILLALTVLMIGYSSYAVVVIRSTANTPLDENSPGNVFALKSYLSREQYGESPLFYGQYYNGEVKRYIQGDNCIPVIKNQGNIWSQQEKANSTDKDKYVVSGQKQEYVYDDAFCTIFPRMYSNQPSHISAYKDWANIVGHEVTYNACGRDETITVPTFGENMKFFFDYQVVYMYGRYFMWNFSGRQNDMQGYGEVDKGSILTGFKAIDSQIAGDQNNLPPEQLENKGRNVYYMLPLLLGIIGMVYQLKKGKQGKEVFLITGVLFFMTGLAIVLYLNQTPYQPRERDYAYAGSFYAFAIWIGMGVLGVAALLQRVTKNKLITASLATIVCLIVPAQMASQNWNDHDRSGRYTCRDFAYDYLMSCAPNAIIFTNGDNDTFPLWYLQEVEGVRRDIRVCNLSYLQTDWYIDQMRRQAYESQPLPISWKRSQYVQGVRDMAYVYDLPQFKSMDIKAAIQDYVLNPQLLRDGVAAFPTSNLTVPINKDEIVKMGIVKPELKDSILPQLNIKLKDRVMKQELMILEMLSQNNWKRPIYFSVTVGDDYYMGMSDNFQLEGLAYRIVPMGHKGSGGIINTDLMFDNMVHKFRWGGIENPKVYLDENNTRMCRTFRLMFYKLVDALIKENKKDKALQALDYCMKVIPQKTVRHDYTSSFLGAQYYQLGQTQKGDAIMSNIADNCTKNISWYASLTNPNMIASSKQDLGQNLGVLENVLAQCRVAGRKAILAKYMPILNRYASLGNNAN